MPPTWRASVLLGLALVVSACGGGGGGGSNTEDPTEDSTEDPPLGSPFPPTPPKPPIANRAPVVFEPNAGQKAVVDHPSEYDAAPNSDPTVVRANEDLVLAVGDEVDHDASQGGETFVDPDGDALSYEVATRGLPVLLSVAGTQVQGTFDAVGLVEVTITARDQYGGVGTDEFVIAAPAPEPGEPALPAVSYRYDDAALPHVFWQASHHGSSFPPDRQPPDNRTSDAGTTLGRVLFYDTRLSITNTVACGSCHQQGFGFTDPRRFSVGALGLPLRRHTMALTNTRYNHQNSWFSDMRVHALRELALISIQESEGLGSSLELVESKLRATEFYAPLFEAAFGSAEITQERVASAIAQFVQALISYRSRFDLAYSSMTREPTDPRAVLTDEEFLRARLFQDEAGCDSCHDGPVQATESDRQALEALLRTLTDEELLADPKFSDPFVSP